MNDKPVYTFFDLVCPNCGHSVKCRLNLDPFEFDQVHFTTCDKCHTGFTYFFDTIAKVIYNGQPA